MYGQSGFNADTHGSSCQRSVSVATTPLPGLQRKSDKSERGSRDQPENDENAFAGQYARCDIEVAGLQSRDATVSPLGTNHGLLNSHGPLFEGDLRSPPPPRINSVKSSGTTNASSRKTPTKSSSAKSVKGNAGGPSPIPAKMTGESLSGLPACAQLSISDYLGKTKAESPLIANDEGMTWDVKHDRTKQYSVKPLPIQSTNKYVVTDSAAVVPQKEEISYGYSVFESILSESATTTPSSDLDDPRKQRLVSAGTASLNGPLEVLEEDNTTSEHRTKKQAPDSQDRVVESLQQLPVAVVNTDPQSLTEMQQPNDDDSKIAVGNKELIKPASSATTSAPLMTNGQQPESRDLKNRVVEYEKPEPVESSHTISTNTVEPLTKRAEDQKVLNSMANRHAPTTATMLPPPVKHNNTTVADNNVLKHPHATTHMLPPPPLMDWPYKKDGKPSPFDCTVSLMPRGHVTALQLDLDQILRSIRQVFLVNHKTNSPLSLEFERNTCVAEMKAMTQAYSHSNLVRKEGRLNFSSWQVRWGYMFMYFMRHAHLVYLSMKHLHHTQRPITTLNPWNIPFHSIPFLRKCSVPQGILKVLTIGGGPGSDLIGLALFLRANRFPVRIRAVVFDICGHWSKSWNDLHRELPPMLAGYFERVQYIPFNYLVPELSPVQQGFISGADLIMIVKSMSPVAIELWNTQPLLLPGRGLVKPHSLYKILSIVASGTLVLYVDNKNGQQTMVMQDAVQSAQGYTIVHHETSTEELPPRNGFSPLCQKFMKWVGYGPCFSSGNNEIVALSRR